MKTYIIILIIVYYLLDASGQEWLVTINQGQVKGHKHAIRNLYEFFGIPYATAPSGRDKFKAPLEAPKWEGVFDATEDFIFCPQSIPFEYAEDCLVVNVFAPENQGTLKPVVVIVHRGAFSSGFGNMVLPYNIVEKNVVAVTLNYRLGAHGFLCLNTENIPGNAGLRDQIAALEWVKHNIRSFGGNSEYITVMGSSAGASSAELLMLSPAANNLFNKVILDSASALVTWAVNPKALELAQTVAIQNGAENVDDITQLENFYLNLSYSELFSLLPSDSLFLGFSPCIEHRREGNNAVVEELPHKILRSGNYSKLPLLIGYTDAEGLLFYDFRNEIMAEMNENFNGKLPAHFDTHAVIDETAAIELIKSFYFDEGIINESSLRNFTDYLTDSYFAYWIVESAKLHASNAAQVYLYEFNYVTSAQQKIGPGLGASHCSQTDLILSDGIISQFETLDENDLLVQERLVDMWTNFIKFSEPISPGQSDHWEHMGLEKMNYMKIGLSVQNENFPLPERLQLWDQIMQSNDEADSANNIYLYLRLLIFTFILLIV